MPVTYDFTLTADQIGTAALKKLNVVGVGDTPSSGQLTDTRQVLNLICKELAGENISLFTTEVFPKTLTPASVSFALDAKYIDVLSITITQEGQDLPIKVSSKSEYYAIEDKTTSGLPEKAMIDMTGSAPTVYLYPVPDDDYALKINLLRLIADFDSGSDTPGMPVKWQMYLVYAVAAYLADDYGLPQGDKDRLRAEAERLKIRAMAFNSEKTGRKHINPSVPIV